MASTINSLPAASSASGNGVNPASQNPGNSRPSLRTTSSLKGPDGGRRQSGSPVDGAQRRNNPPKAWTQGTNPITQKPSYQNQNGNVSRQKSTASSKAMSQKETNTPDSHAHDRLTFLITSFIGLSATVTTKNGDKFTGIFSSSSLEPNDSTFTLKMVHRPSAQSDPARANGLSDVASPYLSSAPDHSMSFDIKEIADLSVADVSTANMTQKEQNGGGAGFRTDADIAGNLAIRERNLQRWEPGPDTDVDLSLESANTQGWDQFEANERLFGATSNYDENIYTTRIDRSDPTYKLKEAEAARIAREIETGQTDNPHLREERGHVPENDGLDEEEKYSGVRRDEFPPLQSGQPNKYTPPARRAPTGQPTVAGAPFDPAIVSAQLARPDSVPKPPQAKPNGPVDSTQSTQQLQPAKSVPPKPSSDAEQKSLPAKPAAPTAAAQKRPGAENATANVETEVLDHFRQFANSEKLKMQERRRNQASYDRTIKLNELMKFSKNFKLSTPVPKDLVPILAKDPSKQEKIIQKAQQQSEEKVTTKSPPPATEQKPASRPSAPGRYDTGTVPPSAPSDRQNFNRGRQGFPPTGPHMGPAGRMQHQTMHPGRAGSGLLSHRLADNLQQRKGAAVGNVPTALPLQDAKAQPAVTGDQSGVSSPGKVQTPTSSVSTKFNVRAMEFKPNPAASTFTPGSNVSSPQVGFRGRSVSRATSPSVFFGAKKPLPASERPSISDNFNPIKRMKKESAEQADKDHYAFNGGIPPAYKTPPTWDVAPGNEEKTYADMFKPAVALPSISPQGRASSNPQLPHQHQLPFHLQGNHAMPPTSGPPHGPHHLHPQHHASGPPHFDDHHRMQMSASTSQMFPSPRLQHSHVAYPSPMAPHAQLAFGQPMPQFYVNQGGPQPAHMRHYPGAPQFVNPQAMGAPMMVQQPSSGPYMGMPQAMTPYTPQMQMYSPSPAHAYPQHAAPPPQPHSGYPSPSRGAPMMMHQGSQPGQPPQPVMFMAPGQHGQPVYASQQPGHMPPVRPAYPQQQPHFSSSPHQMQPYMPHQHRAPSNGFNQMPPHMPSQPPPNPASAPAPHPPEAADEVK